jgi:transcription termination/antitermination protein NusA
MLSLTRPELVALLAEGIVPELRDGRVRIMGVSRAPGVRTKIAVAATVDDIDPVNVMVGRSANRVRSLGRMLANERVDIVAWHPDPAVYLANSLAPAAVLGVEISGDEATARVPQHQMAGAVGERGLNASLAGQLVGVTVLVVPG